MTTQAATHIDKKSFGQTDAGEAFLFTLSRGGRADGGDHEPGRLHRLHRREGPRGEAGGRGAGYKASTATYGAGLPRLPRRPLRNRIAKGEFTLDGKKHTLAKNNGPNAAPRRTDGFQLAALDGQVVGAQPDGEALELTYVSRDGEEGYPAR